MNKLKLTDREWKSFYLPEIFSFKRGKRLIAKDRLSGNIAYYSASNTNNGVTDFISNPIFIEKNKIVVSTFCDAFFAQGEFTASDEMTLLNNKNLNKHNAIFICKMIQSNQSKYAFGRKAFSDRLKRQIIMLPVDVQGNPDWQFMEDYIKQIEQDKIKQLVGYYQAKLLDSQLKNDIGGG